MNNHKNISIDNYQAYLLDYFEGNLQESDTDILFAFLASHPALQAEFDAYENITATPNKAVRYPHKENLLREHITFENYKTWFTAAIEGDLTASQQSDLRDFLSSHPWLQAEFQKFELYKATAPAMVRFPDYQLLLRTDKQPTKIISLWRPMAVAASIALLLVVGYLLRNPVAPPVHIVANDSTHSAKALNITAPLPEIKAPTPPSSSNENAATANLSQSTAGHPQVVANNGKPDSAHKSDFAPTARMHEKILTVPQKSSALTTETRKELPTLLTQETLPLPHSSEFAIAPADNINPPTTLNKIVDLAAAGLKEVNKLSGTEIVTLDQKADKDSHTLAFSIGPFEFSRKVQR